MLPDHLSQLLTSYVDGETSPRQSQAVERLVAKSSEARHLLAQLKSDAQRLRDLPRHGANADFAGRIVELTVGMPHLASNRVVKRRANFRTWVLSASAAAILAVVGLTSYRVFHSDRPDQTHLANADSRKESLPPVTKAGPGEIVDAPAHPSSVVPQPDKPISNAVADTHPLPKPAKSPRPKPDKSTRPTTELATPTTPSEEFQKVDPGVGLILALRDLDRRDSLDRLRRNLQAESAFRVELSTLGNGHALDRLRTALKPHGVQLVIDAEAQARLKNRRLKSDYVLYSEDLTAENLSQILQRLGRADRQAEAKRRGSSQFDTLLVLPFSKSDRKELHNLLGVDPLTTPAKPRGPLGVDIRKPLPDQTASQVAQSLAGQGTPRREPGKTPVAKPSDRLAILLPYVPNRAKPSASKEMKQFLDHRAETSSGAPHLFLILRGVNG